MGTALLFLIGVSILIGYQAQSSKGRNGAGWAVLSFVVLFTLFFFFWPTDKDVLRNENMRTSIAAFGQGGFAATVAIAIGWPVMAILVATLPNRKPSGKKCPDYAELVQPGALKCRFCGHEFKNS